MKSNKEKKKTFNRQKNTGVTDLFSSSIFRYRKPKLKQTWAAALSNAHQCNQS